MIITRWSRRWMPVLGALLTLAVVSSAAAAGGDAKPLRFSKAQIRIEMNETGNDAGIQMLIDGEGWEHAEVFAPGGTKVLNVRARGSVGILGMTELFFESEEPTLDELPLEDLLAMFPEGRYRIVGVTAEGRDIVGGAVLSHDIPAGPDVVSPLEGAVTDANATVVDWDPVVEPAGIVIVGYQVIVELPEPLRVLSVDLPASVTQLTVPIGFLEPGTDYKFEVLAIAEGGNQTITEGTFTTAP
jgi:hypothetical protein